MDERTKHALAFLANAIISKGILPTADMNILHEMACGDFSGFEQKEESDPVVPVLDLAEDKPVRVRVCGVEFDCYMTGFTRNVMATVGDDHLYHVEIDLEADRVSFPRNFPEG